MAVEIDVEFIASPETVLRRAGGFLAGDPVRHNLILTLLETGTICYRWRHRRHPPWHIPSDRRDAVR